MTRTEYVFTLASYFGPEVRFCHNAEDLAAYARGFADRWPTPLLVVSPGEVRAAWGGPAGVAAAPAPAGMVRVGFICKDDLATLLRIGAATVYEERQEFLLLHEQEQFEVFVRAGADGVALPQAPRRRTMADALTAQALKIGGRYNWKNQPERLIYMGMCEPRNGRWHQFMKVDEPDIVWCEVLGSDLHMLEETPTPGVKGPDPVDVAMRLGLSRQAAERMAGADENITAGVPPTPREGEPE